MTVRLLTGDCRTMLTTLPEASVQCCVTSPPYFGLRSYGTESQVWGGDSHCDHVWGSDIPNDADSGLHRMPANQTGGSKDYSQRADSRGNVCSRCNAWRGESGLEPTVERYVENMVAVFREVRRVLRDDGVLFLNLGDSYANKPVGSFNGGGFKDGSAASGGRNMSGVATSGSIDKLAASGLKPKDLIGIPWRVAFALQADGWYLRSDIIWAKPNPMPESVRDRPTKAHEYIFLLTKSPRYFWDAEAVKEEGAGRLDRSPGSNGRMGKQGWKSEPLEEPTGRNVRSVWTISTHPFPGAHFATFPPALAERCIKAGTSEKGACSACGAPWVRVVEAGATCPEPEHRNPTKRLEPGQAGNVGAGNMGFRASRLSGQEMAAWRAENPNRTTGWQTTCTCDASDPVPCVVLDPFGGAGTVSLVAERLGRDSVYIDLSPDYAEMARKRITGDAPMFVEVV